MDNALGISFDPLDPGLTPLPKARTMGFASQLGLESREDFRGLGRRIPLHLRDGNGARELDQT